MDTKPTSNAAAGPSSSQPFGPWPVGCFSSAAADPYTSIQDTLVTTASPARAALKNSQLAGGETFAYFRDRTLAAFARFLFFL